jgi:CRISPR-associated endonuclease/helicase Cas3
MFENPADPDDHRKGLKYQSDPRLYALGHWKKRVFSATVDQFFPFMQYQYGPLCLLPLLVESVLVIDEVHSFDEAMFSTLKRFLKAFPDVPTLCMTATLPIERRNDLVDKCGLNPYAEQETPTAGLLTDSQYPRHRIKWIDRDEAKWLVRGALDDRKRVLWVSNRVADCQGTFKAFYEDGYSLPGETKAFCYHSRFKLDDRKARHKQLIQAFQDAVKDGAKPQAILGATTQVCELSLDLDAEILVTELAPIASLIQRMGRCNRDSKKMRTREIGRVYVLRPEPGKEKPYEKEELDVAKRFVNRLNGRDVSQDMLDRIYKRCDPREIEFEKVCPFLDSGPYAEAGEESFRESDDFAVPCILDHDVENVLSSLRERDLAKRRLIDGLVVPVPRRYANEPRPGVSYFPRWLSVASQSRYDSLIGFDDRERPREGGHN